MPSSSGDEDALLKHLLEGVSDQVGEAFFKALVQNLAKALDTYCSLVTVFEPGTRQAKALAFWTRDGWVNDYCYSIENTPCEEVFDKRDLFHYPDNLTGLFPADHDLPRMGLVSYLGVPLLDTDGTVLGNLAVMDQKPMPTTPLHKRVFRLFAARAAAEHRRLKMEQTVRDREGKLSRLVDGAMDAIVEINAGGTITQFNRAAEKVFGCAANHTVGTDFFGLLESNAANMFRQLLQELTERPETEPAVWISGGIQARRGDGSPFTAEATVSRYQTRSGNFFTLVVRNVEDRIRDANRIQALTEEARQLRQEISQLRGTDLVGDSAAFRNVLQAIDRVAPMNTTVLIQGETGTGKELVARAIHAASQRKEKPLICVNCAAIPANLIESEFFGHERGAFTGATERRKGRFALAHEGSLFLDEVGELPLDLQGKLLRVLQEGTFETVGGNKTQRVDVRLIAATNRDLEAEVKAGRFREDLFYRLNVFPIKLPALRERGEDILLLAATFAKQLSRSMGRPFTGLTDACKERLMSHAWPGNIRELHNVIERALITSSHGRLDLSRAMPTPSSDTELPADDTNATPDSNRILTEVELRELERRNMVRALEQCEWRVSGENGAAALLGIKPSTLTSRMKALAVKRD